LQLSPSLPFTSPPPPLVPILFIYRTMRTPSEKVDCTVSFKWHIVNPFQNGEITYPYFADRGGELLRMYISRMQDSGQIRPERFPVRYRSRVPARRKGRTSGILRPDSAGIRLEQESCPGLRHPEKPERKPECATLGA
jgi:hypothetical protein